MLAMCRGSTVRTRGHHEKRSSPAFVSSLLDKFSSSLLPSAQDHLSEEMPLERSTQHRAHAVSKILPSPPNFSCGRGRWNTIRFFQIRRTSDVHRLEHCRHQADPASLPNQFFAVLNHSQPIAEPPASLAQTKIIPPSSLSFPLCSKAENFYFSQDEVRPIEKPKCRCLVWHLAGNSLARSACTDLIASSSLHGPGPHRERYSTGTHSRKGRNGELDVTQPQNGVLIHPSAAPKHYLP